MIYPVIPEVVYRIRCLSRGGCRTLKNSNLSNLDFGVSSGLESTQKTDESGVFTKNELNIPVIGLKAPIVEGETEAALNRGAWRRPETSTPEDGGNTVITGHRFQFLPPNNVTFYHLDKLRVGDEIFVYWNGMQYDYIVRETFVVKPDQTEIENQTQSSQLTLYTCTPLWTAQKRLVIVAELEDTSELN
jgi:sortase A